MQNIEDFSSLGLTNNDVISAMLKKKSQICNIKCQYYRMTMNLQAYRIKLRILEVMSSKWKMVSISCSCTQTKWWQKNIKMSSEINVAWFN